MKPYELTYIISSGVTSEACDGLKKELENFIQDRGGLILKSEVGQPQILSYPIKKQSSGHFAVLDFQMPANLLKELKDKLEKEAKILRNIIVIKRVSRERKERRTRKPLSVFETKESVSSHESIHVKGKKTEKVELGDIEKKLDEILSE